MVFPAALVQLVVLLVVLLLVLGVAVVVFWCRHLVGGPLGHLSGSLGGTLPDS